MPLSEYKGSVEVNVENNAGTYTVTTNSYNFNNLVNQTTYNYTPGGSPTPTPVTPTAYLTFTESSGATFTLTGQYYTGVDLPDGSPEILNKNWNGTLYYSTDGTNWTEWDGTQISSSSSGMLYIAGKNNTAINTTFKLEDNKEINVRGSIEALLDYPTVENNQHPVMASSCFESLFIDNTSIRETPSSLPATTLSEKCYKNMFCGCTSLTMVPALPATTMVKECYAHMFNGCTSLTSSAVLANISLDALTLAERCYAYMFAACTSLTDMSTFTLPATILAEGCYADMFLQCSSLTNAPALTATILAVGCYSGMFSKCTALTTAPTLLATNLASECYKYMFSQSGLTATPTLPAISLAEDCYAYMFDGCSNLTTSSTLPATTLYKYSYRFMFHNSGLTTAPDLPATVLASQCYFCMFYECSSLTGTIHCASAVASDSNNIESYTNNVPSGVTVVYDL